MPRRRADLGVLRVVDFFPQGYPREAFLLGSIMTSKPPFF